MSERFEHYLNMVDPLIPDRSRVPENLRWGFDAVLFDKDGTLITSVPEDAQDDGIIEIDSISMYCSRVTFLPGRLALLEDLKRKGIKLGIVTGDWREPTEELLSKMGIRSMFDVVITEDDVEIGYKPHPEPFLKARSKLRVHPRRCVMVGDSPDDDMVGAKRLGMKTVLVPSYRWGRGYESYSQSPGPEADVVVFSHASLTVSLLEGSFGRPTINHDS